MSRAPDLVKSRLACGLAAALGVAVALPALALPAEAVSAKTTWTTAKVVRWFDGDTVLTTKGTVRVIGVDTPELGACGHAQATQIANATAPAGSVVQLGNPRSVNNRDRYNRKLLYVVRKSTKADISKVQIRAGAKARYDGLDGYQWHPRQASYRELDAARADYRCLEADPTSAVPNDPVSTAVQSPANPYQQRANQPVSSGNPDLDCGEIPVAFRPIRLTGPDYHALDRDGDAVGCDG